MIAREIVVKHWMRVTVDQHSAIEHLERLCNLVQLAQRIRPGNPRFVEFGIGFNQLDA